MIKQTWEIDNNSGNKRYYRVINTGFKEIPTQEFNFLWECYKQSRSSLEVYEELAEKYKIASS